MSDKKPLLLYHTLPAMGFLLVLTTIYCYVIFFLAPDHSLFGLVLMVLSFVVGLLVAKLCVSIRRNIISHVDDVKNISYDKGRLTLLRFGLWGATLGKAFWKKDTVYPIVVPEIDKNGRFTTTFTYAPKDLDVTISVTISLIVQLRESEGTFEDFNPDELHKRLNSGNNDNVYTCLADSYTHALNQSPGVAQAFGHHDPRRLIAALQLALNELQYDIIFSNVKHVEARVSANTLVFEATKIHE